ncbi:MAG: hypothetical protein JEZ14_18275 [Marinilabiliaceae bacterium]|nr:hypothetical protein [Marinilabiliaceae bacterium]
MKKTVLISPGFLCIHQVNFAAKGGSVPGLDAQGGMAVFQLQNGDNLRCA